MYWYTLTEMLTLLGAIFLIIVYERRNAKLKNELRDVTQQEFAIKNTGDYHINGAYQRELQRELALKEKNEKQR